MSDLVSVIIPTYNRADLLAEAIRSVMNQTYRPIECIVVDDGSTDHTYNTIQSLKEKSDTDFSLVYLHQENEGVQKNGMEYVRMILSSKFILCPPGNISGNTFRIHETVVARRVPLVTSNPPSDPNFESPVNAVSSENNTRSWDKIISGITTISNDRYNEILKSNLKLLNDQILSARDLIESFEVKS